MRSETSGVVEEDINALFGDILSPKEVDVKHGVPGVRGGRREAPFRVSTPGHDNYFMKLVSEETGRTYMTAFLFGGIPFETQVALGAYKLMYATGEKWFGPKALFGYGKTDFFEADTTLQFHGAANGASGVAIELIKQEHGNLREHRIDKGRFTSN